MSKLLLDLAEELDAAEEFFDSSLLLDFGASSEEEDFTTLLLESSFLTEELLLSPLTELEEFLFVAEELDSFAFFSLDEDFSLPELFCELEDRSSSLEAGMTEDEESSAGSGITDEEEESSPHATSMVKRTDRARTLLKIFTEDLQ
jgi:hypothetical protein